MNKDNTFNHFMDIKYAHGEKIDIPKIVNNCEYQWFSQSLTTVNNALIRVGVVEGEFPWHTHENDDEFFFVLSGKLYVDLENETFELNPHQGVTVTKGTLHRTRAEEKTVMLMAETAEMTDVSGDK